MYSRDLHQDQHRPARLRPVPRCERRRLVRGHLPFVLRLLHHSVVEPVREAERGVALRKARRAALHRDRARVHLPGLASVQRPGMGDGRYVQPAHGHSQRHRAVRPIGRGAGHRQRQA